MFEKTKKNSKLKTVSEKIAGFTDNEINLNLSKTKLSRLKFKAIITISSLLECNDPSDTIILKIKRAIPISLLLKIMTENYRLHESLYQDQYKNSYFLNYDQEIQDENDEKSSYIIEIGFHLFFIISTISDRTVATAKEDEEDLEDLETLKDNSAPQGIVGSLFSNITILNQGLSFGKTFLNTGVDFMKNIKKKIKNNVVGTLTSREKTQLEEIEKMKKTMEFKELKTRAIKFFKAHSAHIEITRYNKFYKIYFPLLPECSTLPKPIKREFHEKVNRTSVKTKVSGLLDEADYFIDVIVHEHELKNIFNRNKILYIIATYEKLWENIAFYINLLLNFIIIASYSESNKPIDAPESEIIYYRLEQPSFFDLSPKKTLDLFTILGALNLFFSSLAIIIFWMKRGPLITGKIWRQLDKTINHSERNVNTVAKGALYTKAVLGSIKACLTNFTMLFYFLYIIFLILGLSVHPFFYAFHLADFLRISILKNVIKAIWNPKYQLFLTFVFFVLVEYYFSLISYTYFYDHYYESDLAGSRLLLGNSKENMIINFKNPDYYGFEDHEYSFRENILTLSEYQNYEIKTIRLLANETISNTTNNDTLNNDTIINNSTNETSNNTTNNNSINNSEINNTSSNNTSNSSNTNNTISNITNETLSNNTGGTNDTLSNNTANSNDTASNTTNSNETISNNASNNSDDNTTNDNTTNNTNDSSSEETVIVHWRCTTLWECFMSTFDFTFKVYYNYLNLCIK